MVGGGGMERKGRWDRVVLCGIRRGIHNLSESKNGVFLNCL